jgi:2-dehydro-3-deoxygluconokinase
MLGLRTGIITKLPDNEIGKFIKNKIRFHGVSDDYVIYAQSECKRLGIYYFEGGAFPRKPTVVYDRSGSSFTTISADEIDSSVYSSSKIFHVSGISLALGVNVRETVIDMIKKFKKHGAAISLDVNYRATLWDEETASRRMLQRTGTLEDIMKGFARDYGIKIIATTERKAKSPTKHTWDSRIYNALEGKFYKEDPYIDIEVVDRIGSGDAYVAGVLFGIVKFNCLQKALEFGNAMAALKNTVPGDLPACDFKEIEQLIASHKKTGTDSEMNR